MDIQAYIRSGIIESYILGLAGSDEVAELEMLRRQYPDIDLAITTFEIEMEEVQRNTAVLPDQVTRNRVLDRLENGDGRLQVVSASSVESRSEAGNLSGIRMLRTWKWIAAATVILLLASSAVIISLLNTNSDLRRNNADLAVQNENLRAQQKNDQTILTRLYTTLDVVSDSNTIAIRLNGVKGNENSYATVYWNQSTRDVYLMPGAVPKPAAGKQYQLWAIVDGKPVDAGMLGECAGVCRMKNIPRAQAFAITLEPEGGSASPTLEAMLVMGGV